MAQELIAQEEKEQFRKIFDLFDKNDEGAITWRELGTIMRFLG